MMNEQGGFLIPWTPRVAEQFQLLQDGVWLYGPKCYLDFDLDRITEELDIADPCYVVDGPDIGGES